MMYAVLIDLDTDSLLEYEKLNNVNQQIKIYMIENGFIWKQGNIYFGNKNITAVNCVVVIQKLAQKYSWFSTYPKEVRMLRIEENTDLLPALSI